MIPELLSLFSQKLGNYSHFEVVRAVKRYLRSIDEHVLLSGVAMHINESKNVFILSLWNLALAIFLVLTKCQVINNLLDCAYSWVNSEVRLVIAPIEIISGHGCSIVANNHSIWIDHGDHFEYNPLSELPCSVGVSHQVLDETLHHIRTV